MLSGSDAVHPAFSGGRAMSRVRDQQVGDLGVVAEHIGFGRAGFGVEHLVEMGQREAVSAHGHRLGTLPRVSAFRVLSRCSGRAHAASMLPAGPEA